MVRLLIVVIEFLAVVAALVLGLIDLRSRLHDQPQPPRIEQPVQATQNTASPCEEAAKPAGTTVAVTEPAQSTDAAPLLVEASPAASDDASQYGTVFTFQELQETRVPDRMVVEVDNDSR